MILSWSTTSGLIVVLFRHVSLFIHRGDIVIAKSPTDPTEFICKRLVAMEGDRVWVTVDEGNDTSDDNCEIQQVKSNQFPT